MITLYISLYRRKKHISQLELSRKVGMSQSHLSKIERGETMPTILELCQIAKEIGVPETWLYLFEP